MCRVDGCDNVIRTNGYCMKHYTEIRLHGEIRLRHRQTPNDFIVENGICKIGCYNKNNILSGFALIDVDDIEKCRPFKWNFDVNGYVCCGSIKQHQLISGMVSPDHINRNPADNRKENLREATAAQQVQNRKKQSNNTSGFKGVSWFRSRDKWRAYIGVGNKFIHIGYFLNRIDAAKAYNKKAKELFGQYALLNTIPLVRRRINESK